MLSLFMVRVSGCVLLQAYGAYRRPLGNSVYSTPIFNAQCCFSIKVNYRFFFLRMSSKFVRSGEMVSASGSLSASHIILVVCALGAVWNLGHNTSLIRKG